MVRYVIALLTVALAAGCQTEQAEQAVEAVDTEALEAAAFDAGYADGRADAEEELTARIEELEAQLAVRDEPEASPEPDADHDVADGEPVSPEEVGDAVGIRIVELYEPDEAEAMIQAANQFNDPPQDGHRFLLVRVEVSNHTSEPIDAWDLQWHAEGPEAIVYYDRGCGVLPSPELSDVAAISPGGSQEGHVCFEMREGDATATGERSLYASAFLDEFEIVWVED